MKPLKVLVVDDDEVWAKTFCDNLRTVPASDLAGPDYEGYEIKHVTNQVDVERVVANPEATPYDLVLQDLNYPKEPGGPIRLDATQPLQGIQWLPELRRLQPKAAIVILTAYAYEIELQNAAVAAIREHRANDFVPKTVPFLHIIGRLTLGLQNARQRQKLLLIAKEWKALKGCGAARVYAQDVSDLISNTRLLMDRLAQRIESGDPTAIASAPEDMRNKLRLATKELNELTERIDLRLTNGQGEKQSLNLPELVQLLLDDYAPWIEQTNAKTIRPAHKPKLCITTLVVDLKMALHEVIANAIESLSDSARLPHDRLLNIAITEHEGSAIIDVEDNGDGFANEALANLFKPGFTTRDTRQHPGMGLYVARRMMYAVGGDIKVENIASGGARVRLMVPNL
jgi:signal transduction histidine kinase